MNYKLNISYVGSEFSGWQIQKQKRTIQGEIENALFNIFSNKKINLIGSGRTDAGVHAKNQYANFKVETNMTNQQIIKAINSYIGSDVYVKSCEIVNEGFNSRFSAQRRDYEYHISKIFSPFNAKYKWHIKFNIDQDILLQCAELIIGEKDFSIFCKTSSRKENNKCTVIESNWYFSEDELVYKIKANRFLHHMVRFLVGSMIETARGKLSIKDFEKALNTNMDFRIIKTPAHELFLNNIKF